MFISEEGKFLSQNKVKSSNSLRVFVTNIMRFKFELQKSNAAKLKVYCLYHLAAYRIQYLNILNHICSTNPLIFII